MPSVLNRKRPVPSSSGTVPRRSMARKPTPSEMQLSEGTNKATPPPPEDAEPVDKVTLLEAKLSSLHKRKANIATVIQELTNVVQPSPESYDVASRAEIRKTGCPISPESKSSGFAHVISIVAAQEIG